MLISEADGGTELHLGNKGGTADDDAGVDTICATGNTSPGNWLLLMIFINFNARSNLDYYSCFVDLKLPTASVGTMTFAVLFCLICCIITLLCNP